VRIGYLIVVYPLSIINERRVLNMDLENYINDLEIDSSDLMDIPEVKVEMETYVKELAELLKDCIQYYLDLYYDAE